MEIRGLWPLLGVGRSEGAAARGPRSRGRRRPGTPRRAHVRPATQILAAVKGKSPGTNDKTVQRTDLLELKASERTAYAEMGFHTYY